MKHVQPLVAIAIAVLATISATLAAYLVAAGAPPVYRAQAQILLSAPSSTDRTAYVANQISLISSATVLEPVARGEGMSYVDLSRTVSAAETGSSSVVVLSVENVSPSAASRIAKRVISEYQNAVGVADRSSASIAYLQDQIQTATKTLGSLKSTDPTQLARRDVLLAQITAYENQLTALKVASLQQGESAQVITPPYVQSTPVSPRPLVAASAAFLVCCLLIVLWLTLARRHLFAFIGKGAPPAPSPTVRTDVAVQ